MIDHYEMRIGSLIDELEVANEEIDKLKTDNKNLFEFVKDCSVSHNESRYKYRAQTLLKELKTEINCKT